MRDMDFKIVNGKIAFFLYNIKYIDNLLIKNEINVISEDEKDIILERIKKNSYGVQIEKFLSPNSIVLDKIKGKEFNTYEEASNFIFDGKRKTELEILKDTLDNLIISVLKGV